MHFFPRRSRRAPRTPRSTNEMRAGTTTKRLSEAEKTHARDGVAADFRCDGRTRDDHRPLRVRLGALPAAAGSAEVSLGAGSGATRALCAVRCDVTTPSGSAPNRGRVVVRVDATASAKDGTGRMGRDAEERAKSLGATWSRAIESALVGGGESGMGGDEDVEDGSTAGGRGAMGIDLEALCIQPGKACWTLAVDATAACDRGSMLDALSIAVRAALADAKIPKVTVGAVGAGDESGELEIDDDPEECSRLDVRRCAVIVTTQKIGRHGIVDATSEEEACADATMSVGVDRDGMVCTEMAFGTERLDRGTASAMRKLACKVGVELIEKMDAFLASAVAADEGEDEEDDADDRVMVVDVPNGQSTDMMV